MSAAEDSPIHCGALSDSLSRHVDGCLSRLRCALCSPASNLPGFTELEEFLQLFPHLDPLPSTSPPPSPPTVDPLPAVDGDVVTAPEAHSEFSLRFSDLPPDVIISVLFPFLRIVIFRPGADSHNPVLDSLLDLYYVNAPFHRELRNSVMMRVNREDNFPVDLTEISVFSPFGLFGMFRRDVTRHVWFLFRSVVFSVSVLFERDQKYLPFDVVMRVDQLLSFESSVSILELPECKGLRRKLMREGVAELKLYYPDLGLDDTFPRNWRNEVDVELAESISRRKDRESHDRRLLRSLSWVHMGYEDLAKRELPLLDLLFQEQQEDEGALLRKLAIDMVSWTLPDETASKVRKNGFSELRVLEMKSCSGFEHLLPTLQFLTSLSLSFLHFKHDLPCDLPFWPILRTLKMEYVDGITDRFLQRRTLSSLSSLYLGMGLDTFVGRNWSLRCPDLRRCRFHSLQVDLTFLVHSERIRKLSLESVTGDVRDFVVSGRELELIRFNENEVNFPSFVKYPLSLDFMVVSDQGRDTLRDVFFVLTNLSTVEGLYLDGCSGITGKNWGRFSDKLTAVCISDCPKFRLDCEVISNCPNLERLRVENLQVPYFTCPWFHQLMVRVLLRISAVFFARHVQDGDEELSECRREAIEADRDFIGMCTTFPKLEELALQSGELILWERGDCSASEIFQVDWDQAGSSGVQQVVGFHILNLMKLYGALLDLVVREGVRDRDSPGDEE